MKINQKLSTKATQIILAVDFSTLSRCSLNMLISKRENIRLWSRMKFFGNFC